MITRDFSNNFGVQDWTEELAMIPNIRTPLSDLGIFRTEPVSQTTVTFEQTFGTLGLIGDTVRGGNVLANKDETRKLHTYQIPYHKVIDYITQADVQGVRAYGSADQAETEAAVMERKMTRLKRSALMTEEYAKFYALTQGSVWTPNGTIANSNFYTDFGVTRKQIAFDLSNAATNVVEKVEEAIAHIQDNALSGDVYSGVVALCSTEFFSALISQAGVKEAYKFYTSTQEPLRNGNWSQFRHGDILLLRYNGKFKDASGVSQALIPDGDAYYLPLDTSDTFKTYFSPANKFDLANTLGESGYLFVYEDGKGSKIEIESEMNTLNLMKRPQCVVRAVKGATV